MARGTLPSDLTRLFVAHGLPAAGETVGLPDEEARHGRSRRLADGDRVVLLDGLGGRACAVLGDGGRTARVEELLPSVGEPDRNVTVVLAAAEPARIEWAIEKGTECGACGFVLFEGARSQTSHTIALRSRGERLRRIAREAVKQCGRTVVPAIAGPLPLVAAVESAPGALVVAVPGAPGPSAPRGPLTLVIGPEGGLSDEERVLLLDSRGGVAMRLGPRVLRLETAVVVGLSRLVDLG